MAIVLSRVFYFIFSAFSKKAKTIEDSLDIYKISNLIRYILLIVANIFNIVAFFTTELFLYLLISVLLLALNFAYRYGITAFKKDFVAQGTTISAESIAKLFE